MAASADDLAKPEKTRSPAELWALAAVAVASLVCVCLLAVALALILGKGSLIQVNPVINGGPVGAPPKPVQAALPQAEQPERSGPAQKAPVDRGWISQDLAAPLPGAPATPQPTPVPALPASLPATAAAPVPAPAIVLVSPTLFQVRGEPSAPYFADQALPRLMPADRKASSGQAQAALAQRGQASAPNLPAPASTQVPVFSAAVAAATPPMLPTARPTQVAAYVPAPPSSFASAPSSAPVPSFASAAAAASAHGAASAPGSAAAPASAKAGAGPAVYGSADQAAATPGPGSFVRASCKGALADLRLLTARSAASLDGFGSSQGNLFFTAHVLVGNRGSAPLALDSGAFDLRDADGDSYMAVPGPAAASAPSPLAPGGKAGMTVTFLVPDDASLLSLALNLPSETDIVPLSKK